MDSMQKTNGEFGSAEKVVKPKKFLSEKNKKLLFFICMAAPLILQVCVFYIYVNVSNIMLAFSEYKLVNGVGFVEHFVWLDNFKYVIKTLFKPENVGMFGVSFLMYCFVGFLATPVSIIFSYYVYKKYFLSEFFRIILFFPQIVSTVIMATLYKFMIGEIYMQITGATSSLLHMSNGSTTVVLTIIFYNLWMGFGANILLASGAMSGISESVVESCHLDGCNTVQEFLYITLPSIYPTIITFVVIDLAAIFSNQMNLYTFFAQDAPDEIRSIGYFLYVQTVKSPGLAQAETGRALYMTYPQISALGLMITLVVLPVTLTVRKLMKKFGPSEE